MVFNDFPMNYLLSCNILLNYFYVLTGLFKKIVNFQSKVCYRYNIFGRFQNSIYYI